MKFTPTFPKILIQLDTEPQYFDYEPERFVLNRFGDVVGSMGLKNTLFPVVTFRCNLPSKNGVQKLDNHLNMFLLQLLKKEKAIRSSIDW